jgi:hypothetical protein
MATSVAPPRISYEHDPNPAVGDPSRTLKLGIMMQQISPVYSALWLNVNKTYSRYYRSLMQVEHRWRVIISTHAVRLSRQEYVEYV